MQQCKTNLRGAINTLNKDQLINFRGLLSSQRDVLTDQLTAVQASIDNKERFRTLTQKRLNNGLLDLGGVRLEAKEEEALADALRTNSTLTHFRINYNDIGFEGSKAFCHESQFYY